MHKTVLVGSLVCFLMGCSVQGLFEQEQRYFEEHIKDSPKLRWTTAGELHFVAAGNKSLPTLIFIHGTPGNWRFAARYLMDERLLAILHLVSVDRPGWGNSSLPADSEVDVLGFTAQAARFAPLLQQIKDQSNGQPIYLVGHSLGASLAPQLALDYPALVDGLVLIAGALDPGLGKPRWYNLAASMGIVSWFLREEMRRANREIMPMHKDLAALAAHLGKIEMPVTIIQGMKDGLVYPANADYAEQAFVNADLQVIRLPEAGHLIPWQNRDMLVNQLLAFISRAQGSG